MSTVRGPEAGPFASDAEHLAAELERLDLLLAAHLDRRWAEEPEAPNALSGLYISVSEVARHLTSAGPQGTDGADETGATDGTTRTNGTNGTNVGGGTSDADEGTSGEARARTRTVAVDRATWSLRTRTARTLAAGRPLRLPALADRLDLDRAALDALVVALAPAVDRKYGRVYAYLHDDATRNRATVGLVGELLGDGLRGRSAPFGAGSPLVDRGVVSVGGDPDTPLADRPLVVPERVVDHLLGEDALPGEVSGWLRADRSMAAVNDLPVDDAIREDVERLVTRVRRGDGTESVRQPLAVFDGPYGTGRADAVEAVCSTVDRPLLTLECSGGLPDAARLRTVALEALLRDAAVHLRNVEVETSAESGTSLRGLLAALDDLSGPVFVTGDGPIPAPALSVVTDHATVALSFPRPSFDRRRSYWAGLGGLPDDADPSALASTFRLSPGAVDDAMATARRLARSAGEPLAASHVYAGARAQTGGSLGRLATRIEPRYDWDDIVLPADTMTRLREVAAHLRHRGTVYDDWGFAERFAAGAGLTALFAGPSGTGKTMAAEVLASDAGLDLYRVDLSTVVDKYIGETEKNLGRVFDAAVDADAILLFDEADALFGSRSTVSDAHDRYANVEVSYLLQRIEAHDGPVLLTTNLKGNVDEAFLRRITVGIEFPRPDRDSRAAIWGTVFPAETPVGDLDVAYLAGFELTGGNIENVARAAAFLAADDPDAERVEMTHVVRAVRRELQKNGRLTTPDDFAEYRDLL